MDFREATLGAGVNSANESLALCVGLLGSAGLADFKEMGLFRISSVGQR
jgi:hypothetical protein